MAYYVPILISGQAFRAGLLGYLGGTILPYLLMTGGYVLVGNPILVMKWFPGLMLGLLGFSAYLLGRRFLDWSPKRSFFLAVLFCSYFVTLRLSWDLHRNVFGLVFVLLTLAFLRNGSRHFLLVAVFASIAVMSHESSAVVLAIVVFVHLSQNGRYRHLREWLPFVPAGLLVVFQLLTRQTLVSQIQEPEPISGLFGSLAYNLGFLVFAFVFLIPVALIGLKMGIRRHFGVWTALCLIFGLLPDLGVPTGAPYRWTMLLALPLTILFAQGIVVLNSFRLPWHRRLGRIVAAVSLMAIIVMSSGYVGLNQVSKDYFRLAPEYRSNMPISMVESTVSLEDMPSLLTIFSWANETLARNALLVLPLQLYGWYVTTASAFQHVKYDPSGSENNLDDTISDIRPTTGPFPIYARNADLYDPEGQSKLVTVALEFAGGTLDRVYVVWWKPDSYQGPAANLPDDFAVAFASGNFALYLLTT